MSNDRTRRVLARLAAIQESAALAVDAKVRALKATGCPVIRLGAGEPNSPTPESTIEAAVEATRDPKNHKYTPAEGLPELCGVIAARTLRDSGNAVDLNDVIVTNGGKQAVFRAFAALTDDGDEMLFPAPYWTAYPKAVRLAGGVPVEVFAGADAEYKASVKQFEAVRTDKTKALLLYSSSNPTGSVYSPEEARAIGQWTLEFGTWVISDETYEHLVYDGTPMGYILSEVPELVDRAVVLNGVAKTYAMTGQRVGWVCGPPDVIKAVANFQSHATSNVANVPQRAALATLTGPQDVVAQMREAFDRRCRKMIEMLGAVDGFAVPEPKGAFYVYPNVEAIFGRDVNGRSAATSAELAALILEEAEVVVVPGEAFGPSGFLRFSYALSDEGLIEGLGRV